MLLLAPDSLDCSHIQIESRSVTFPAGRRDAGDLVPGGTVPGWTAWPVVRQVRDAAQQADEIALTGNPNPEVVQRLLQHAAGRREDAPLRIICAEEPLPAQVRSEIPEPVHRFLRRILPTDLLVMTQAALDTCSDSASVAEEVFSQGCVGSALSIAPGPSRFPAAGPGTPIGKSSTVQTLFNNACRQLSLSETDRLCLRAGLLLIWDHLDEAHEISQSLEGKGQDRTADYWHAIMHRREPDPDNAAYWFRKVGRHPAFELLSRDLETWMRELDVPDSHHELARRTLLPRGRFDPSEMTALSQTALKAPESPEDLTFRLVQYLEMLNLLRWSCGAR